MCLIFLLIGHSGLRLPHLHAPKKAFHIADPFPDEIGSRQKGARTPFIHDENRPVQGNFGIPFVEEIQRDVDRPGEVAFLKALLPADIEDQGIPAF